MQTFESKPAKIPYKVYLKDLKQVEQKYSKHKIDEVSGRYNMLYLPENAFICVCENKTYYLITI